LELKEESSLNLADYKVILFGFELSRTQRALFLILSYIGLIYLPFILIQEILYGIFHTIFVDLPFYFSPIFPEEHKTDFWFYLIFAPEITRIIVYSILFYLSIYTLKTVLKPNEIKDKSKKKIIRYERIVNWFGFKLTHGQSLFIFYISLIGILFSVQNIIEYSAFSRIYLYFFVDLCHIPLGAYLTISNQALVNLIPIILNFIILLLSIYSLIKMRRGKLVSNSIKSVKNYAIIIYLISLITFLFFLMRLFCHLFLFTDLGSLLGITPNATNSSQANDFTEVIVILIITLIFMIGSYFIREHSHEEKAINTEFTWIHIKLTPKRATFFISLAFLYTIFFSDLFLTYLFIVSIFNFPQQNDLIVLAIFFIIIIICYYLIETILKKNRFNNYLKSIDNLEFVKIRWLKFNLSRSYSLLLFSVSCGFLFIYIYSLMSMNLMTQIFLFSFNELNFYYLISFPISLLIISILLSFIIYTIKRTSQSIKLH
jgi:hypothetical protein